MDQLQMLSHLLDNYPYRIVYVDTDHVIRYMNKHAIQFFSIERGLGNMIGRPLFDCHPPQAQQKLIELAENAKTDHRSVFIGLRNNGELRAYFNPVYDENDCFIGYFERYEENLAL